MSRLSMKKVNRAITEKSLDPKSIAKFVSNTWINNTLGPIRTDVLAGTPKLFGTSWSVDIHANTASKPVIGTITVNKDMIVTRHTDLKTLERTLKKLVPRPINDRVVDKLILEDHRFYRSDSLVQCAKLKDASIPLLLTDPPYGISSPYSTEKQIPRRLRKNGADFIMPKGEFGAWDHKFSPQKWTDIILPKVNGWVTIFCAHRQIPEYSDILDGHGFVAVNALVWHKTNPVPFNHKFKMLSAWESAVMGKRPATKFNGKSVHNVFTYKSPSPQHRIHPTQKPVALMEKLVELFTDKGDLVLDPFAGGATTTLACMNTGRKSLAFENDRKYFELAVRRIRDNPPRLCC